MKERGHGYFQVSLMNVFRQAAANKDAKKVSVSYAEDGRVLNQRTIERREGASQEALRDHLATDLTNLLCTVHLAAAEDLEGLDHVKKSVLNYGMQDMTRLITADIHSVKVMRDMRASLLAHEPRLIAETLVLRLRDEQDETNQRIAFNITAEMAARPVDVPMEFVAEIDVGVGKMALGNLKVQG